MGVEIANAYGIVDEVDRIPDELPSVRVEWITGADNQMPQVAPDRFVELVLKFEDEVLAETGG